MGEGHFRQGRNASLSKALRGLSKTCGRKDCFRKGEVLGGLQAAIGSDGLSRGYVSSQSSADRNLFTQSWLRSARVYCR